jgi:hypothetical protein
LLKNLLIQYNTQLINTLSKVILTDYIKAVHELFYKDIDISFMDYSLKICQKGDEFCINPVDELNIKVDELLKLIHKFLSNQINLLYTFNSNID